MVSTIETLDTRPFKHMIMTIGELPSSFVDSMSYYEMLAWLCDYLEKQVVPVVNNNSAVVAELKDYVEHYFDNLDVQEEIDNKLDEMAEAGTLQEIITSYIQSNVAWTFDTVADMKLAENLIAGSYAQTLGFHSLNDGGGAKYYITDSGTANEMNVIAVGDLYANLVIENSEVNAKQFGCYGDNIHDDGDTLNAAILYAYLNNYTMFIPSGTFCVNSTIKMYGASDGGSPSVTIKGNGRDATIIKAAGLITNVVEIDKYDTNTTAANMFISDFSIQGNNNATNGIYLTTPKFSNSVVRNIFINECSGCGITYGSPKTATFLDSFIKIRVRSCETGIDLSAGDNTSLRIADCYVLLCTNAYAINGAYSTFENNCADHCTGIIFKFNYFTGTILNPGSESSNATCMFNFTRTRATVLNAYTFGNMENASAVHINLATDSKVKFIGGRIMLNPETSQPDGTAEGKLYQLGGQCELTFDKTQYSAYKLRNTYRQTENTTSEEYSKGRINKRYDNRQAYIGIDTSESDGIVNPKDIEAPLLGNAIYFGLGSQVRYCADGTDWRYLKHTTQGDILLSRKPAEIGGIGWIQADDMTAEGAGTEWTNGTYMKIPVISSGATADRPTASLAVGQMYYDTTLNKPIWYKGSSVWVDATGTSV